MQLKRERTFITLSKLQSRVSGSLLHNSMYLTLKSYYTAFKTGCLPWIGLQYTFLVFAQWPIFLVGGYSSHPAWRSLWGAPLKVLEVYYKPFSRVDSCWAVKELKESITGPPVQQHPELRSRFDRSESFKPPHYIFPVCFQWKSLQGWRGCRQHYSCLI